jgi:hypothetical protein
MVGLARTIGATLVAIGLVAVLIFAAQIVSDREYAKAALRLERSPGNIIYEARYGVAFIKRALLVCGGAAGVLVALNGTTFLLLGSVAARQQASEARTTAADAKTHTAIEVQRDRMA